MKILNTVIVFLISLFLITSCQKELYFEGTSSGSLKIDSLGTDCLPSEVVGYYQMDSVLNGPISGNYIEVQVNVTYPGEYTIKTDTVNGYYFIGTGTFGHIGVDSVRLYGYGRPLIQGTNTFLVEYNNTFCYIDVDVNDGGTATDAVYTLGGDGSTCTGAVLTGTFMESLPATSNNTASIDITVSTGGNYTLSTPVLNGVSFSSTGSFTTGNTGVTLTASGTPIAAGTFNYTVSGAGTFCTFSVVYAPLAAPATYVFTGAPTDCSGATLSGNYTAGVATSQSNTANININVSTTGSYNISTPQVNGVSFQGTGLINTAGNQTLVLYAIGIPAIAGTFNYTISGSGSTCTFSVTYDGAPTNFITCDIDGVFTTFNIGATAGLDNSSGVPILGIDGSSSTTSDPSISLQVIKSLGGSITAGTYNVNQLATGIGVSCDYFDATSTDFAAVTDAQNQNQNPAFTITITSITTTRCIGTFEGPVKDSLGSTKIITQGIFNVPIQ
jgi:hypothetical protein